MNYFERYKNRSKKDFAESLRESTEKIAQSKFSSAPSAVKIFINKEIEPTISRTVSGDRIEDLEVIFPPNTVFDIGDLFTINNDKWLVFSTKTVNIMPKAVVKRCNHNLKWSSNGTILEQPAIIKNFFTMAQDDIEAKTLMDLDMSKGGLFALMQYNEESKQLKIGAKIEIQSQRYRVDGIDDVSQIRNSVRDSAKKTGIIKFTLNVIPGEAETTNHLEQGGGKWW